MPNYKSDTNGSGKALSTLVAFAFFVLSVVALFLPDSSQDEVASLLRGSVLRPFILTQEGLVRRSIHAEDTEVLQRRLDSLEVVIANSNTLSEENTTLRSLLLLSNRNPAQYVAASVIRSGTPGSESMFMLDVGTRRGVTKDSPVMMGRGLLGVVRRAQANRATAMDWTHPQFRASAMTVDGSVYGMVRAAPGRFREADRLLLNGVPFHQELGPGVTLVTSGLGGLYPRGIRIGVVIEESGSQEGWQRSYWLRPFVSPGEATHVNVLVGEEGESHDANSWSEGGPQEPAPGTSDTEATTPQ
ncbi:MAG: rod shape-determining protein MreC [Gemmatimonadetes bacterium]|nr:rod shape-determining protein MreC [Gemmatimonadota bacterium]